MPRVSAEVRIRPDSRNILDISSNKITVGSKIYSFSRVHNRVSQAALFNTSVLPFVEAFAKGEDCTVLAYGQTGSGKTYTMGLARQGSGLIQLTLEWVFRQGLRPTCSFIEIYNEEVYDLLAEARVPLSLRQSQGGMSIVGMTERAVESYEAGVRLLQLGNESRTTKATKMNLSSSRSHAMFVLGVGEARMSFVDLAGSERLKRTECRGSTAREAISINAGLLALGNVISALYLGKAHVPFRDSKLTRIMQGCLSGRVLLLACVSGRVEDAFETGSTLKYASRAAMITLKEAEHVGECRGGREVLMLKKEISALKDENRRLKAAMIGGGMKDEKIRGHPLVAELLRRLRIYEGGTIFDDVSFGDISFGNRGLGDDINLGVEPDNSLCRPAHENPIDNPSHKPIDKLDKPIDDPSHKQNENSSNKRTRLVSFNLKPILQNSLSISLSHTTPDQSPLSFILHGDRVLFNSLDSKIKTYEPLGSVSTLVSDDSIRCLASSFPSLFFSSRSLIKLFSPAGRPMPVYAHKVGITALKIRDSLALTGHEDGTVNMLDMRSNTLVYSGRVHAGTVFDMAVEDGSLYTCSRDHSVRYSSLPEGGSGVEFSTLVPPHYDSVSGLVLFKGQCISLGRDCAMKVWRGGEAVRTVPYAHEAWIKGGSAGEKYFVTGCKGGVVKCWDIEEGEVKSIGKVEVGVGINSMILRGEDLIVGGQNRMIYEYKLI